jgi:hypothetical protein
MAGAARQVYAAFRCLVLAYDHAQIARYELPVISAVEEYGPAGRFIQSVQQPKGEAFPILSGLRWQGSRPTNIEGRAGEEDFYRGAAASFAGSDCAPQSQELSV